MTADVACIICRLNNEKRKTLGSATRYRKHCTVIFFFQVRSAVHRNWSQLTKQFGEIASTAYGACRAMCTRRPDSLYLTLETCFSEY
jgi:hypothetical protein